VSAVPKQIDRSCSTTVLARPRSAACKLQRPGQMDGWMDDASKGADPCVHHPCRSLAGFQQTALPFAGC